MTASHAVNVVLEEIGYGVIGGMRRGRRWGGGRRARRGSRLIAPDWLQVVPVGAAALAYGIAAPLGGSGFIAAFVGGLVFGAIRRHAGGEVSFLLDQSGEILNAVTLIVFGASSSARCSAT